MGKPQDPSFSPTFAANILRFLHVAENLKNELRHSYTSKGRHESVAEHTWRAILMATVLRPQLPETLNWERLLEMLVIHDLAEAITGDIPIFDSKANGKKAAERKAMDLLRNMLPPDSGARVYDLWEEFEGKETPEAQIANAFDKLEAQVQHNEADLATWLEWEKQRVFGGLDSVSACDPAVTNLKEAIIAESKKKLSDAGENLERFEPRS